MDYHNRFPTVDLNGSWSMALSHQAPQSSITSESQLRQARLPIYGASVPGNFELDLVAAGVLPDPFIGMNITRLKELEHSHLFYFRRFQAMARPGFAAELEFAGLDCCADIYVNGTLVGSADNMLVPHVFCVDELLRGDNELLVHIRPAVAEASKYPYPPGVAANRANYESLYVRKAPHMYGWDIMPRAVSAGIWRPVRLVYRPEECLDEVYLETTGLASDHSRADLVLHYVVKADAASGAKYDIVVGGECGNATFRAEQRAAFAAGHLRFGVGQPKLWWPKAMGEANLYKVTVTLLKDGQPIDEITFNHGIRKVALERSSVTGPAGDGKFCFNVNGERVFVKGSNWVPADAFHSRDRERIPRMLDLADDLGCNMLRCWGGNVYEDDLFFEICDSKGIMIWQDFAMACAMYPQDASFAGRLSSEVRQVVKRLRQHACLVLWAGDNENDVCYAGGWFAPPRDPNSNILTRRVIPDVLREEDPNRPYLPSSPYIDQVAYNTSPRYLPEEHLWGPRDYYKSDFYKGSLAHFASEMGYHGCPAPESIRRFITPDKVWPYHHNEEWLLHSTSPVPELHLYDYRVELMANQIGELFGQVPDNLDDFAFASQVSQAEAKKFFVELFRGSKWRRTGIIWWNLIDGWPQFSDAIVDYYFVKKLAYHFLKVAQQPVCLMLREPENWGQNMVAVNDTRQPVSLTYSLRDIDTGEVLAQGEAAVPANGITVATRLRFSMGRKRFYVIEWQTPAGTGKNHYLAGNPPFDLQQYRRWLRQAAIYPVEV